MQQCPTGMNTVVLRLDELIFIHINKSCLTLIIDTWNFVDTPMTRQLIGWLWLSDYVGYSSEWVSEWVSERLIDWLIDWVSEWVSEWACEPVGLNHLQLCYLRVAHQDQSTAVVLMYKLTYLRNVNLSNRIRPNVRCSDYMVNDRV